MIDPLQYQDQEQYDFWGQQPFKPATQQPVAQAPVAQQPAPVTQGPLDIGQRTPQVRPDPVQAPVAQQPVAQPVAQAPAQRRGHEEIQGSGDSAYSSWVWDEPDPNEAYNPVLDQSLRDEKLLNIGDFDLSKYGWKGPTVHSHTEWGPYEAEGGYQANKFSYADPEFAKWANEQGFKTAYTLSGNSGNQTRTNYLLDKEGNVLDTKQYQVDLGSTGFLDKLAAAMPAIIVGLGTGGLGALAAGALAGAAAPAIKGFTEGQNLSDALKGIAKGAAIGGLGGAAAGYINPAAAEFGKAVGGGNEFLTKLATDAASGAGRGLVGSALTGGKNLGESVLMGAAGSALGGAANAAMGEAAGAAGIPPEVMRVLGPTAMAALTGKDWRTAGLTSLLGAAAQSAGKQPIATTQADFTEQWYPSDYPVEKDQQLLGGSPLVGGMSLASIQPALDALDAAGQKVDLTDIGKLIAGQTWGQETPENPDAFIDTHDEGYEADPDKFVDGLINQMYNRDKGDLEDRQLLKGMGNVFGDGNLEEDYVVDQDGNVRSTYTGEAGTFVDGKWVPKYTAPTQKTAPTKATTPTKPAVTPTTPTKSTTSSGGGLDMNSLMALLALMGGGEQQAAPAQPLFRSDLDVNKIFKNWMA